METIVAVVKSERPDYGGLTSPGFAPELPDREVRTVAQGALRELFQIWGLDTARLGSPEWNPLGAFVRPNARIVIKPNWVSHQNKSGAGLDSLLTHPSVIEAVLRYVSLTRPASVVLGDAPLQGCDFNALRSACGLDPMLEYFRARGMNLRLCDFRRTALADEEAGGVRRENLRPMEEYVLFDLKHDSLLEALAADATKFRVTMYNPDLMWRTHAPARHQYLIARDVIQAQVVISLPKLKCHKKACITGALKNLVGINGNKEYLPHHRKGGCSTGGDCYAGGSRFKGLAEGLLDAANRREERWARHWLAKGAYLALRGATLLGADDNLEGAWYGNDTVWRTCLDLQRILRYGREDGTLAETPQRKVISITDAIVAGEDDGPLAPTPVLSGFLTGAENPAAAEWVHARLMGFDPTKIPLVRHAFDAFSHPIAKFTPSEIRVLTGEGERSAEAVFPFSDKTFRPPKGWQGTCELHCEHALTTRK
jgi:uncharacterized protein (DUF362 family)